MLAAEFHYTREYCDRYLDLDDFIAHIKYHKANPPAGAVLISLVKSFVGNNDKDGDDENKTYQPEDEASPIFTEDIKDKLKGMNMDEKFKFLSTLPLTPEQVASKSKSLDSFMTDFGSVGGNIR